MFDLQVDNSNPSTHATLPLSKQITNKMTLSSIIAVVYANRPSHLSNQNSRSETTSVTITSQSGPEIHFHSFSNSNIELSLTSTNPASNIYNVQPSAAQYDYTYNKNFEAIGKYFVRPPPGFESPLCTHQAVQPPPGFDAIDSNYATIRPPPGFEVSRRAYPPIRPPPSLENITPTTRAILSPPGFCASCFTSYSPYDPDPALQIKLRSPPGLGHQGITEVEAEWKAITTEISAKSLGWKEKAFGMNRTAMWNEEGVYQPKAVRVVLVDEDRDEVENEADERERNWM